MEKLLLALVAALLVSIVRSAACPTNRFGGDCSCTSDVDGLISSKSITGFVTNCNSRVWQISGSGSFNIGNAAWHINTDLINLGANFNSSGASIYFILNAVNSTQSGYVNVQGVAKLDGFVNFVIGDWDKTKDSPEVKLPFFKAFSESGTFVPYSPTVPSDQSACWDVNPGASVSANSTGVFILDATLKKKGGSSCGGPSDRGWVIAFIVILILWGAGLGLFALITCKIDSCYAMWWELK